MNKLMRVAAIGMALVFAMSLLSAQTKMDKKDGTGVQTLKGYLTDKMCGTGFTKTGDAKTAAAKAKKHTKDCALEENCMASGYGLVFDGKFHKFDEAGDKIALEYLNKTKKENNLFVMVKGTMDGDKIKVTSVKDTK